MSPFADTTLSPLAPSGSAAPAGRLPAAGVAGLLAAAAAVSVGHLVASLVQPTASPLLAVGSAFIDLTPEWLKSFAIATFGEGDKTALLIGLTATLAVLAVIVGLVALRRLWLGVAGVAAFGLVGAATAILRPTGTPISALPSLIGAAVGIVVLVALVARLADRRPVDASTTPSRRRFLTGMAGAGLLTVVSGGLGILLTSRRAAAASAGVATSPIPVPMEPLAEVAGTTEVGVTGVAPFFTPNDRFYRVDTALDIPVIAPQDWQLRIHGMVDREITLTFEELLALPVVERDITLACVSNVVGGPYVGNARWIGVPLATVLDEAGVQAGADQIVSRSIDGMTIGTPTAVALDGRDAMLAVAMNGEPLPPVHGYPVRMIVPGLYGYVSATKWLVDIELTTFDAYDPYWVERGWAKEAPIKTMSRIDAPKPLARIPAGKVAIGGVAWAQHRGIDRVEVRIDDGEWRKARLATVDTIDTWRQWAYEWDAKSGNHTLQVRATDANDDTQPETRAEPFPSGATGWHSVVVTVE